MESSETQRASIKITFQLTAADYYYGLLVWRSLKPWRRWLIQCAYLVVALTVPMAILLVSLRPNLESLKSSGEILGFAVVWFGFMLGSPWISAKRQFAGTPSAQSPMAVEASDEGLVVQTAHGNSNVGWSAYIAWAEGKSVFAVLPQPRIYIPIPKRAFTAEQLSEFRELLRRNIKPRQA